VNAVAVSREIQRAWNNGTDAIRQLRGKKRQDCSHGISFNNFKMVEIEMSVVDALPATFSLDQQWVEIV
jgi:hypothetical protein